MSEKKQHWIKLKCSFAVDQLNKTKRVSSQQIDYHGWKCHGLPLFSFFACFFVFVSLYSLVHSLIY